MTLLELRKALEKFGAGHDAKEVKVWLPGSRVLLRGSFFLHKDSVVLIEGNIESGSALDNSDGR